MRTMYDSVSAWVIPANAEMVAGYVDGLYAWSQADWTRFPNAVKVRIAVHPRTNDGHVLDVESGDATPGQAPAWVTMRRKAGMDPSVYCSLAVWDQVRLSFSLQGVASPHYWIAAYPGNGPQLYEGSVAHQYRDTGPNGENVDMSVVADVWPGVDTGGDTSMDAETLSSVMHSDGIAGSADPTRNGTAQIVDLLTQILAELKTSSATAITGHATGTIDINIP